jgi:hypothetical protein
MSLNGDGLGCQALTVRGPGEREVEEGELGDVSIGDDKVARRAASIQEWKAGQSQSPHAGNRGGLISVLFFCGRVHCGADALGLSDCQNWQCGTVECEQTRVPAVFTLILHLSLAHERAHAFWL